ncbi:DUF512 domain-containing protein [candidate division WOR-3 bacterium]|nr:DUF512 domain-containing protein [candidate division WOR-3 bacterium]
MPVKVVKIHKKGLFRDLGIRTGDEIISVNGNEISDYFDLSFWSSSYKGKIIWKNEGVRRIADLSEFKQTHLGVDIEPFKYKMCANRCAFCFVDQNPKNSRVTLNFKDDDYRLSFLGGAYITGTNLTESEIIKITKMRLSPIYISVHASDAEIRGKMFGRDRPAPVMPLLKRLVNSGIAVHTQVVVVPGINDGKILEKTLSDLTGLKVRSVALVPVGLTKHRKNLAPLKEVSAEAARGIINLASSSTVQKLKFSTPVYCTDQMFLTAKLDVPERCYYGDYPQLENGVGGIRLFLESIKKIGKIKINFPLFIMTGEAMHPFVQRLADKISTGRLKAMAVPVANAYFGKKVNTAGLISGNDFLKAAAKLDDGLITLPCRSINHDGYFIDDLKPVDITSATGRNVLICPEKPGIFFNKLDKLTKASIKSKHAKTFN